MHICSIHSLLHHLGISQRFTGYGTIMEACQIILHGGSDLCDQSHALLEVIARRRGVKVENIERNLRTAILHAWQTNPDYLCSIAGYSLGNAPSVSEFIDILACALLRNRIHVDRS